MESGRGEEGRFLPELSGFVDLHMQREEAVNIVPMTGSRGHS